MVVFTLRQTLADLKLPHDVNFVACVLLLKHKDNIVSLSMDQLSHNRKQDDQLTQGSRCVSVRSSHSDRTQNHLEYQYHSHFWALESFQIKNSCKLLTYKIFIIFRQNLLQNMCFIVEYIMFL